MKCREYEARHGPERNNADLIDLTTLAGGLVARDADTDCEPIGLLGNVFPAAKSVTYGRCSGCRFVDVKSIGPAGGSGQNPSLLVKQSLFRICHSQTDLFE